MQDWNATARNIQSRIDAIRAEIEKLQIRLNAETDNQARNALQIQIANKNAQIVRLEREKQDALDKAAEQEKALDEARSPRVQPGVVGYVPVPDPASGASYEEVAAAVKNNLLAELSELNRQLQQSWSPGRTSTGTVAVNSRQQQKLAELNSRISNFDSWFRNVWNTEYKPVIGSRQPPIPVPITFGQMAPQAIQNQSLQQFAKAAEAIKSAPQTGAAPIKPLGQTPDFNKPVSTKPPISSQSSGTGGNPVDENGIPMVQTSAGWVKDRRFYKPDGTLFGTM